MDSRKRLTENVAALTMLQLLHYAAPLITVPYLVRILDPAQFGLLSFAQGIALYLSVLTDYGFDLSATRAIATNRDSLTAIALIFWSTVCAKAFLMVVCGVVLLVLVGMVPQLHNAAPVHFVSFLYVIGTAFFPIWLFQGTEKIKLAAIMMGTARLLTIPALFLFVRHPADYVRAAAIQASVEVIASAFAWPVILLHLKIRWVRPSIKEIVNGFVQAWPLFLSGSAFYVSTSSTTVLLGLVSDKRQVGYYSAAEKLVRAAIAALNPVTQALFPHVMVVKAKSSLRAFQLLRKSFRLLGSLSLALSVIIFLTARPVCRVTLGSSFSPSISILRALSPLAVLFGLIGVFGTQTLLTFQMDRAVSKIMLAAAALGAPLTLALSWRLGGLGAAFASTIVAATTVVFMMAALNSRGLRVWSSSDANLEEILS
jgi:PST family polysaccharide transporter